MRNFLIAALSLGFLVENASRVPSPSPTGSMLSDRFHSVLMKKYAFNSCNRNAEFARISSNLDRQINTLWKNAFVREKRVAVVRAQTSFKAFASIMSPPAVHCEGGITSNAKRVIAAIRYAEVGMSR